MLGNSPLVLRRGYLDLGVIGMTLATWFALAGPWEGLRSFVAPWFLFLLPGCALVLLVKTEVKSLVELVATSFLTSVGINLIIRLIFASQSLIIASQPLINELGIWTLGLLLVGYVRDAILRRNQQAPTLIERSELALILFLILLYTGMSLFVLRAASYTPTPDELTYLLNARQFNLAGAIPVVDATKVWLVNFVLSRPLWFMSLGSYLLVSATTSPFSAQVLTVFFLSMLVLATYRVARRVVGGEVGLIACVLLVLSPSILIWGSTVLLDLPLAVFLILGYGYFIESVRLRGGKLEGIAVGPLVLAFVCFLFSSLLKLADPVLPALVYVYFVYLVWKSEIRWKRLVLSVLILIPLVYLTFDGLYNVFTYVLPNTAIHNVIRPFLPVSVFERFFAIFYQGTGYKSVTAISPLGIVQGMYLAGLAPYLITYPVLFMSVAGLIIMARPANGDISVRWHAIFSVLVIGLVSLLAALFLYPFEIARNVIYIYPFIIIAAAVGFLRPLRRERLKEFVVIVLAMVAVISIVETSMLRPGISLGTLPAPDQHRLSILSVNFLVGAGVLAWKILESTRGRATSFATRTWKGFPIARLAAVTLVCVLCFSQFFVFTQTSPYRSVSNFNGLSTWLNSHVHPGDVIFTNGREALTALTNDTTLQLINQGGIRLLPVANSSTELLSIINSTPSASSDYMIIFNQGQYTDTNSYTTGQFFTDEQFSDFFLNSSSYQIYVLSSHASYSLSLLNVFTTNSTGGQISGYYAALWQNGRPLDGCFTPCAFYLKNGETYQVYASSFGGENFTHWLNDSSTGFETVTAPNSSAQISVTAVYDP